MFIYCPKCNMQNADDSKFCIGCGSNLSILPPSAEPNSTSQDSASKAPRNGRKTWLWRFFLLAIPVILIVVSNIIFESVVARNPATFESDWDIQIKDNITLGATERIWRLKRSKQENNLESICKTFDIIEFQPGERQGVLLPAFICNTYHGKAHIYLRYDIREQNKTIVRWIEYEVRFSDRNTGDGWWKSKDALYDGPHETNRNQGEGTIHISRREVSALAGVLAVFERPFWLILKMFENYNLNHFLQ